MNPRFSYIYRRGCHSSSQPAGRAHGLLFLSAVLRGWYADGGLRSLSVSPDYLYNYTSFSQNGTLKYLKFVRCFVRKNQNQSRANCAFLSSCTLFYRFSSEHAVKSAKNTSAASTEKNASKIPHSPSAIESCPRPGLGQGQESVDNVNSIPKQHSCSDFIETGGVYLGFDTLRGRKFPHGNFRTTRVLHIQNTDCRKNDSFSTVSYRPNDFSAPYISGRRSRNTPHEWRISRIASRSKVCVSTPSFSRSACSTSAPVSSAMNDEP